MWCFIRQQLRQNMNSICICSNHFFAIVQLLGLVLIFVLTLHFFLKNRKVPYEVAVVCYCACLMSHLSKQLPEFYKIFDAGFDVRVSVLFSLKLTVSRMVTPVCQINSINVSYNLRQQRGDRVEIFVSFHFDGDNAGFRNVKF